MLRRIPEPCAPVVRTCQRPPLPREITSLPADQTVSAVVQACRSAIALACLGETFACSELAMLRERAVDPVVKGVLTVFLSDEIVHARVGWAYLAHALKTASDNVLRLGMTSKEVAVGEALAAVRGDRSASVLPGSGPIWPAGAPFRLDVRRHVRSALLTGRYRVVVAIDGPVHIAWEHESVDLDIGQAVLVADDEPTIGVSTEAMVAMVEAVPVADRGIGG